jgi:hypothetical protein
MNKPKKPKESVSLKKAVKTFKKNHKQESSHTGSHNFSAGASPYSTGTAKTKNTYKPSARQVTTGGTKAGKGATFRKKGRV